MQSGFEPFKLTAHQGRYFASQTRLMLRINLFLHDLGQDELLRTNGLCSGLAVMNLRADAVGELELSLARRRFFGAASLQQIKKFALQYRHYQMEFQRLANQQRERLDYNIDRQDPAKHKQIRDEHYAGIENAAEVKVVAETRDSRPDHALKTLKMIKEFYIFIHSLLWLHALRIPHEEIARAGKRKKFLQLDHLNLIAALPTDNHVERTLQPALILPFCFSDAELTYTLKQVMRADDKIILASQNLGGQKNHALYLKVRFVEDTLVYQLYDSNYKGTFYETFTNVDELQDEIRYCLTHDRGVAPHIPLVVCIYSAKNHIDRPTETELLSTIFAEREKAQLPAHPVAYDGTTALDLAVVLQTMTVAKYLADKGDTLDRVRWELIQSLEVQNLLRSRTSFFERNWSASFFGAILGWSLVAIVAVVINPITVVAGLMTVGSVLVGALIGGYACAKISESTRDRRLNKDHPTDEYTEQKRLVPRTPLTAKKFANKLGELSILPATVAELKLLFLQVKSELLQQSNLGSRAEEAIRDEAFFEMYKLINRIIKVLQSYTSQHPVRANAIKTILAAIIQANAAIAKATDKVVAEESVLGCKIKIVEMQAILGGCRRAEFFSRDNLDTQLGRICSEWDMNSAAANKPPGLLG